MTGSVLGASSGPFTAAEMRSPIHRPSISAMALGRLAARYGIEAGFRDARGKDIVTRPETRSDCSTAWGSKPRPSSRLAQLWMRSTGQRGNPAFRHRGP
jgi:hypothetical protein